MAEPGPEGPSVLNMLWGLLGGLALGAGIGAATLPGPAPAPAPSPDRCALEAARLERQLRSSQQRAEVSRSLTRWAQVKLEAVQGVADPWGEVPDPSLRPETWLPELEQARFRGWAVVHTDCTEPPCMAVLEQVRARARPPGGLGVPRPEGWGLSLRLVRTADRSLLVLSPWPPDPEPEQAVRLAARQAALIEELTR